MNLNRLSAAKWYCCLAVFWFQIPAMGQISQSAVCWPLATLDPNGLPIEWIDNDHFNQVSNGQAGKRKFKKYTNIRYHKSSKYELLCDLYIPAGKGPFPGVIAIHGGAWRQGTKLQMIRHCWKLVQSGFVVMAINYRHAPEHKFPAQVHDCKCAVRWMRNTSVKLKVNPVQIAAFGYSAGGHLAAMLGSTDQTDGLEGVTGGNNDTVSSRVQCVVVGGGPCEFDWIKSKVLEYWLGDSPDKDPDVYEKRPQSAM